MIRNTFHSLRRWVLAALLLTMPVAPASAQTTGTLTYPAQGNLDLRAGTFECWVQLAFDPTEVLPVEKYHGLASLTQFGGQNGGVSIGYAAGAMGWDTAGWTVSVAPQPPMHPGGQKQIIMKPGEWHHIALTWDGRMMRFYVDGEPAGARKQIEPFRIAGPVLDRAIHIGDQWHRRGRFVIDELRISSVAREPEELGWHGPLKPDPYTSLLDRFDEPIEIDGETRTRPVIMHSGEGGLPTSHCRFVEGRFGQGLALYPEAEK